MVIERYIHHIAVERPPAAETASEARERLREKFPRTALRRMTHLGLLVGSTLDGIALTVDDAVVYASTFAETRALEEFLRSFPSASPLLFQTSIHPGAVQQALIGRQQPIGRLWPLAGRSRLVEQALLTALLEPAARVILAGGEERGTWMLEHEMASDRAFAFALVLTREAEGVMGVVNLQRDDDSESVVPPSAGIETGFRPRVKGRIHADDPCPELPGFTDALAERRNLTWRGAGGKWSIEWR